MRPSSRHIPPLILCALGAFALASAIALATPGGWGARRLSSVRAQPSSCRSRAARARRRHARHVPRCHASKHHPSTGSTAPAASGSPAASGATGATSSGASSQAISSPPPASLTGTGESTPAPAPPSVPHVQVSAVEYSFTLSRTTVPAGKVIFEFVNDGQDEHNLNVLGSEGPPAGTFPDAPPKAVSDQTMVLRAGTYTLFCSLPEHEQKGMKATLLVQ
jgi:plastocyanin